ncbi:MAG: hypothetical protein KJ601_01440, partial [Nanoarchaeota archaeon]|nr:hypothetical protein [Nanoarchaeota archaeon]
MHSPQYFEGILQLRDVNEEIIDYVSDQIHENNIQVAKEIHHKNGIDIYVSSNKFLRSLGKRLQRMYTGEFKESATLHTRSRQTGKDLYRVTLFFRPVKHKIGDIITYKDEEYRITSIGKKVNARSI